MALSSSVVGQTYAAAQVSSGTDTAGNTSQTVTYTETGTSPYNGTVTVNSYNAVTNMITYTVSTAYGNFSGSGTVVANGTDGFLVNGTVVVPIFGSQTGYVYVTNTSAGQPGLNNSIQVPTEAAGYTYTPACYCRGTLVRTPDGPRPVEDLAEGDLVLCLNGGVAPVRWIGRRAYAGRFLRGNPQLRPIRFRAGSLGPSTPSRDLLVSPRHAMLVEGVLVPAELLVNGASIVTDAGGDTVEYLHVELDEHDAIWAEDALSETFLDDGSRGVFHNVDTFRRSPSAVVAAEPVFCAPIVRDGEALARIRERLARRVAAGIGPVAGTPIAA